MVSAILLWIILIALLVGVLLLLRRTHHRTAPLAWRPDQDGRPDADLRRVRQEFDQAGARGVLDRINRLAGAVLTAGGPVPFDRARAELLERPASPGDADRPDHREAA